MTIAAGYRVDVSSPIEGVSVETWEKFQRALEVAKSHVITLSGGYGAFDLRPRRLVELGYARGLRRSKINAREIWKCDFVPPWTERKFLLSSLGQIAAFRLSMRGYVQEIKLGRIVLPSTCSLAGALAILHTGGRKALAGFPELFENTKARYLSVKELF